MKQKKLLLLGGSRFLFPVIEKAHELGIYVITADYLPDNAAHRRSDEYINVSVIDKEAVLKVAKEKNIDGISAFACDSGVVTASYVAEKMGIPFHCSYDSTSILQDKEKFRNFLREHHFNCPLSVGYASREEALHDKDRFIWPMIVKPVDSAASKGVSKVENAQEYNNAVAAAFEQSITKKIIIEEYLDVIGYQSSTDVFTVDGAIHYPLFSDQIFDEEATNPFVPIAEIWPTSMPVEYQKELTSELNRLFSLLHCRNGLFNVECRMCSNHRPYIMEVSPRGGGNHIAKLQDDAYGLNYIENEIRSAVGLSLRLNNPKEIKGHWCSYSVHPQKYQTGRLKSITFNDEIKNQIQFTDMSYRSGQGISPFTGANKALGDVILHSDTRDELSHSIALISDSLILSSENISKHG